MSKITKEDFPKYVEEAQGLERNLCRELEDKAKRGWLFGWGNFVLAMFAVGGLIFTANKPEEDPLILRVDNTTGVVERITTLAEDQISTNEADDIYWINKFINNYESYNYASITDSYNLTLLLSSQAVAAQYVKHYDGPQARDIVLSNKYDIKVNIASITPDLSKRTAVVRYTTQKVATTPSGVSELPAYWIGYLRYDYVAKAKMSAADRRLNPKAFQVVSFRSDPEVLVAK